LEQLGYIYFQECVSQYLHIGYFIKLVHFLIICHDWNLFFIRHGSW